VNEPPTAAAETLFLKHEEELGRFLIQLLGDPDVAADVLQETFLVAVKAGAALSSLEHPRAWLYGVARNKALHASRSWRRRVRLQARMRRPEAEEPSDIVAVRDLLRRTLSRGDQALVLLTALHGFSAAELAAATGDHPDTIRKRLSRARRKLLDAENAVTAPRATSTTLKETT